MHGQILVKGLEVHVNDITLYDVIKQLQSIMDVEFQEAEVTKLDYFDLVSKLYATAICPLPSIEDKALVGSICIYVSMLFESAKKDPIVNKKLVDLGAKPIDFAFMNSDVAVVQNLLNQLDIINIFSIAKSIRMYKFVPIFIERGNDIVLFEKSSASLPLLKLEDCALCIIRL